MRDPKTTPELDEDEEEEPHYDEETPLVDPDEVGR